MSKVQEKLGKRPNENSLDATQLDDGDGDIPIRDIENLFCSSVTINCALQIGCVPCAYKVCCFDVALDSAFCKLVPNQRPEQCPRSKEVDTSDSRDGETIGYKQGLRTVLTVGDGDFSFSLAIARLLLSKHDGNKCKGPKPSLVATSYESRETLRKVYPNFDKTASELDSLGAILCFEVDATRLAETLPSSVAKSMKFNRIIWNFPCTAISQGQDGQNDAMDHNKQLVREFVENARRFMVHGGELQMCHKTKPPFNQWKIEEVALELRENSEPKVCYKGRIVLDRCLLPPYQPRKALHAKSFPCHDACFYVFSVSDCNVTAEAHSATLLEPARKYDLSSNQITSPGLYPVSPELIHCIRDKLLAQAATKRNKQNNGGKYKKRRKR